MITMHNSKALYFFVKIRALITDTDHLKISYFGISSISDATEYLSTKITLTEIFSIIHFLK